MKPNLKFLQSLKVGDIVTRMLAGTIASELTILNIHNSIIKAGLLPSKEDTEGMKKVKLAITGDDKLPKDDQDGWITWDFSLNTGGEIDTDLGYDGINTCSYLMPKK